MIFHGMTIVFFTGVSSTDKLDIVREVRKAHHTCMSKCMVFNKNLECAAGVANSEAAESGGTCTFSLKNQAHSSLQLLP